MKNIAIIAPKRFFTIPALYGGACEELMTILIDENEKHQKENIYLFQHKFNRKKMVELNALKYDHTTRIYIKVNKVYDFFVKVFNKVLKIFKSKKRIANSYDKKVLQYCQKMNFDKIIFEAGYPDNISEYSKNIPISKLFYHYHCQPGKLDISHNIGNGIFVSNFCLNDYKNWLETQNYDNNFKYHLLKNTVNEDKFNKTITLQEREGIRKQFDFNENDFIVTYCGRILQVKGVLEVVEAISRCPKNIKLLIIGSPNFMESQQTDYLTKIQSLITQNEQQIKFTGYVDNNLLYKYYQIGEVQVMASLWEDAGPLTAIEGVISGIPQVATNSGGIPELTCPKGCIILKKEKGLIESLAETFIDLNNNRSKLLEMKKANIEFAKCYTKQNYYNDFVDIMEDNND